MGPLPCTLTGKRYIVVAVDHFTKWVEAKALEEADAQSITTFIYEDIICHHGVPQILSSDRGTEFINELIAALTSEYKIKHIKTTAYHPEGNGQVE
jgi:transposase InsO family protein